MSDELPRQESLDETRARLNLDGPPAPPESIPPTPVLGVPAEPADPGAPPVPRSTRKRRAASIARVRVRRSNARAAIVVAVVVGVVVAGVAIVAVAHGVVDGLTAAHPISASWKHYPGTAYDRSSDVLAAPTKEQTIADAEALISEYKQALSTEFGLSWTKEYEGYTERASNGYGGDSMLYDYASPQWQGSAVIDDPGARKRAFELFSQVATAHGATDVWLANDVYSDDAAESKKEFGGTKRETAPEWGFYGDGAVAPGATVSARVIDLNVPRDPSFVGDYWFELDEVPAGSFVVEVSVDADTLLAASDRDEFTRTIATYDESHKPEPH